MNTKICPTCKAPIPANAPGGFCPACILRNADEPAPAGRKAPSLAEVSAAFPQLEVLGLIGQGGMGFVYKVRQPSLDRVVALKILSPELARDPAFAERFAREARVLGKLNHPNIVTVFEHGVTASQPSTNNSQPFFYLLMEFVDGVNLRQAMRAGRFTPQQALAVVPGICDALQAAHAQGVWHRDIKPENILLDARGGVKIADFGIARIVGDPARDFTLTSTGAALGSAPYMAPEQHEKPHDVDHRADIYSLGVVIYEMLTGELPLGRFPAPSERAAVSARIDEIVFQTLEKERELRQQSAAEVKTDVHRAETGTSDDDADGEGYEWSFMSRLGNFAIPAGAIIFGLSFAINSKAVGYIGGILFLFGLLQSMWPEAGPSSKTRRNPDRQGSGGGTSGSPVLAEPAVVDRSDVFHLVAKSALIGGIVLFLAAAVFTHGSTQGAMLALANTIFILGLLGLLFGKRGTHRAAATAAAAPAGITSRSIVLFLGGLAACAVGAWIYNGGVLSGVLPQARHIADQMGAPTLNTDAAMTVGTILIALGAVSALIGYGGLWYALWLMRHGLIPPALRGLTRSLAYSPLALALVSVVIFPTRRMEIRTVVATEEAKRAFAESPAEVGSEAQPAPKVPTAAPRPRVVPAATSVPAPAVRVEEIFRKMNALANESDGEEFRKHTDITRTNPSVPYAEVMAPFFGKVIFLKTLPDEGANQQIPGIHNRNLRVLAALEDSAGAVRYTEFLFVPQNGEWRFSEPRDPEYRVAARVEFRPEKGNPLAILRSHVVGNVPITPVNDTEGQFEIAAGSTDADVAARGAHSLVKNLESSLTKLGLDRFFKIIKPADRPTKPWMADDGPVPTKVEARPGSVAPPVANRRLLVPGPLPAPEKKEP